MSTAPSTAPAPDLLGVPTGARATRSPRRAIRPAAFAPVADGAVAVAVCGIFGLGLGLTLVVVLGWTASNLTFAPARPIVTDSRMRAVATGLARATGAMSVGWWLVLATGAGTLTPRTVVVVTAVLLLGATLIRGTLFVLDPVRRTPLRALVVGGEEDLAGIATQLADTAGDRLCVIGAERAGAPASLLDHPRPEVDVVVVVPGPELSGRAIQRITWRAERQRLPLLVCPRVHDATPDRTWPVRLGRQVLLELGHGRHRRMRRVVKQVWERGAAALALLALTPLLLALAVAIRWDSPGPALFFQQRIGRDGRPFTMWKLRTMGVDAEARRAALVATEDRTLFKLADDPRITRIGGWLRHRSLDELPQLVNVVRGEMSLVGPRPALPEEVATFDEDPRRRFAVRPGITGLWQVSGRSDLTWEETVRLDLDYVDNWSLGRDVGILLRTVRAVLKPSGAY